MNSARNNKLQELCRNYLSKLKYMARKHGIGDWVENIIIANKRKECVATEKEVKMLGRLCDDERLSRLDIPKIIGKSYRACCEMGAFEKITKYEHVGTYSKVSAELYSEEIKEKDKNKAKLK